MLAGEVYRQHWKLGRQRQHSPARPPTSLNASAAACILETCFSLRSRVGPTSDLAWKPLHRWLGRCFSCTGIDKHAVAVCLVCEWRQVAGKCTSNALKPVHSAALTQECNNGNNATLVPPRTRPELLLLCGELAQEPNLLDLQLPIQHQPPDACRRCRCRQPRGPSASASVDRTQRQFAGPCLPQVAWLGASAGLPAQPCTQWPHGPTHLTRW